MSAGIKSILANHFWYYHLRQLITGGLPFKDLVSLSRVTVPDQRIADIGCGPADILRFTSAEQKPEFYLGLDVSPDYLSVAKRQADKSGLNSKFVQMDLTQLPANKAVQNYMIQELNDNNINSVLLMGVVHHIDDNSAINTFKRYCSGTNVIIY